jgi:hypothetical protein
MCFFSSFVSYVLSLQHRVDALAPTWAVALLNAFVLLCTVHLGFKFRVQAARRPTLRASTALLECPSLLLSLGNS